MDQDFEETWRPVTGFEGLYEVSNLGDYALYDTNDPNGPGRALGL